MSFFSKPKRNYVAAPAKICSRCHKRMGEIEVLPQAIVDARQTRSYWFCGKCADESGRKKPTNS